VADEPIAETVVVDAPPAVVWRMVSDVTRMPQWSPELFSAQWVGPVAEPRVGARFRGTNRHKVFRWTTSCEVIAAQPDARFAYRVSHRGLPVSEWAFDIRPSGTGCEVTQSTVDRRGWFLRTFGSAGTGVLDRTERNRAGIAATLAAIKAAAEQEAAAHPGATG
jgi:uncharacterized protein YndB with AHSA1/START domain